MPRTYTARPRTPGKRPKHGGRKKGSLNRTTVAMRDAMLQVFAGMQATTGRENGHLLDWALANSTHFYKLSARLIPHQVAGEDGGPAVTRVELVAPGAEDIAQAREEARRAHDSDSRKLTPSPRENGAPPVFESGQHAIATARGPDGEAMAASQPRQRRRPEPYLGENAWML